jgi:hypothetical protein
MTDLNKLTERAFIYRAAKEVAAAQSESIKSVYRKCEGEQYDAQRTSRGPRAQWRIKCWRETGLPVLKGEAHRADVSPDVRRHRELERRLRDGPYLGDGCWNHPVVHLPLSLDEWEELVGLREKHGWGEDLGEGEMRTYWRPTAPGNVSRGLHRYGGLWCLRGREHL